MKIAKVELFRVAIPLSKNKPGFFGDPNYFVPSWVPGFRQADMGFYLLRLVTDNGIEGVAAIPALASERAGLGSLLGTYLLGLNPLDITLVNQRIQEFSYLGMRNGWIDAAFWDIIGKHEKKPLWQLLNGTGGSVRPYLSMGSTHNHDQKVVVDLVKKFKDQGYGGIKLRVKGEDLNEMSDYVGAARNAVGDGVQLMVDSNQGWPVDLIDKTPKWSYEFALRYAKALEEHDVSWLEEPLNRGNFEGLAELRQNTSTPISGGELNSSWRDFKEMLRLGSLDIYQPDAVMAGGTFAGGITLVYHLMQEIKRTNETIADKRDHIKFCPHTWTTGLGFAIGLQLVGVMPEQERKLLEYPTEGHWKPEYWNRFIKQDFTPKADGTIDIPDRPGLGVDVDWDVIRRFGKRIYSGTKASVGIETLKERGLKMTKYLKAKKAEQDNWPQVDKFEIPSYPF